MWVTGPGTGPGQPGPAPGDDLARLLARVARGDEDAFAAFYDTAGGLVYGLVRRIVRDPAQSEEVTQDVLLDAWRTAARFDARRGSALAWVMTMAHRRAVDRVRSEQAAAAREQRARPDVPGNFAMMFVIGIAPSGVFAVNASPETSHRYALSWVRM